MQIKVATATITPPANPISFSEIFVYTVPPNQVPQPIPRLKIPEKIAIATDDAAAETVGHAAPQKQALGQDFKVRNDRRPGPGKAGHAFKEAVEIRQVAAEAVRKHAQKRSQHPADSRNGNAFAHGQFLRPHVAVVQAGPADESAENDAAHKRQPARFPHDDRHGQGQKQDAALGQGYFS